MSKKCEHQQPSIKVTMHIPATDWHPHYDKVIENKAPTEYEAWAKAMVTSLAALAHDNARLMVGFWGDALNTLPVELRKSLVLVIGRGLGLQITSLPEQDSIEVELVERYEPLTSTPPEADEMAVPTSGLVLPDTSEYNK